MKWILIMQISSRAFKKYKIKELHLALNLAANFLGFKNLIFHCVFATKHAPLSDKIQKCNLEGEEKQGERKKRTLLTLFSYYYLFSINE